MMRFLTRRESRKLDESAMVDYGLAGLVLMENAGAAVARETLAALREVGAERVVVVCGKGNNAGDGFVAARHLVSAGIPTSVLLLSLKEELRSSPDAWTNFTIIDQMAARGFGPEIVAFSDLEPVRGISEKLSPHVVVVDAILGTGLTGDVRKPASSAIDAINSSDAFVVSVDIPSGLDADKGVPLGTAVRADVTVTMAGPKAGFSKASARGYVGKVVVAEIGCGFLLQE